MTAEAAMISRMPVLVKRIIAGILLVVVILYAGDWLVYRCRVAHASAFDSVKVNQFIAVPLKNGRNELDYMGSAQVGCVRAIFPRGGGNPCWWVRRHADQWT